ncbi:TIP41-like protein isoform X4 [Solanum dulcamara]|uniref:TIP41-like protein isoform X4 n=1 Tax=Solanum dulcamara TaxID=45834 RepID=UPI0024867665|nr:TIP41-like protein isoform X4 [Solanum dulcamara]
MEWESDDKELKAAGAEPLPAGRRGVRIHGWEIDCRKLFILNSVHLQRWEKELQTTHLPEMVFGDNCLVLKHMNSGTKLFFNAFDALVGWKHEALSPVEVPAAAKWKFRSKPLQQVVLDYDYTFTTPYCGSETVERNVECGSAIPEEGSSCIQWEDCKEKIDLVALASKEPILFYDEIILYEDELADNGISLLTIKVLRVDGVLMRLRDTRLHCLFGERNKSCILRESCWRETTFQALASKGYPSDAAAYSDPSIIADRLPIVMQKTQKLNIGVSYDQNLVYIGVVQNPIAISGPASPRNQPQQTSS